MSEGGTRHTTGSSLMDTVDCGEYEGRGLGWKFLQPSCLFNIKSSTGAPFGQEVNDLPIIHISWILLDTQFTISLFSNGNLLVNIGIVDTWMDIHCNTGLASNNQFRDLLGYGMVWYNPNGITNILLIVEVEK